MPKNDLIIYVSIFIALWILFKNLSEKKDNDTTEKDNDNLINKVSGHASNLLSKVTDLFKDNGKEKWYEKDYFKIFLSIGILYFLIYQLSQDIFYKLLSPLPTLLICTISFGYWIKKKNPKKPPVTDGLGKWIIYLSIIVITIKIIYPYITGREARVVNIKKNNLTDNKKSSIEKTEGVDGADAPSGVLYITESIKNYINDSCTPDEEIQGHINRFTETVKTLEYMGKLKRGSRPKRTIEGILSKPDWSNCIMLPIGYSLIIKLEKDASIFYRMNNGEPILIGNNSNGFKTYSPDIKNYIETKSNQTAVYYKLEIIKISPIQ